MSLGDSSVLHIIVKPVKPFSLSFAPQVKPPPSLGAIIEMFRCNLHISRLATNHDGRKVDMSQYHVLSLLGPGKKKKKKKNKRIYGFALLVDQSSSYCSSVLQRPRCGILVTLACESSTVGF
ncbi:hypothetical protein PG995_014690 [Apiospora arundinis]